MNPKQKLFAEYYCGQYLGNAEQAAIAAGYSPKYARGHANLLVAKTQEYIVELNKKMEDDAIAKAIDIKTFWTHVMNDEDEMMKNRLRASELLAKTGGMFNDTW